MQRIQQLVFAVSLVALCWFGMMALHELGHVMGAVVTGGTVRRVVLHPLTISRTDVDPNPAPGIVVWMGPILGSVLPLGLLALRFGSPILRNVVRFFTGFCLIANGAYIGVGWFDRIGDCGEMIQVGTPIWLMVAFGAVATASGLVIWHRLGSAKKFLANPQFCSGRMAWGTFGILCLLLVAGFLGSPN